MTSTLATGRTNRSVSTLAAQMVAAKAVSLYTALLNEVPRHDSIEERFYQTTPSGAAANSFGLSKREIEILTLLSQGKQTTDIALELFVSEKTVANPVTGILHKMKVGNRTEAARLAAQRGITG